MINRLLPILTVFALTACGEALVGDENNCDPSNSCHFEDGSPTCDDGYIWEDRDDPKNLKCIPTGECVPTSCGAEGKNCGTLSNGCGDTLQCGSCTLPETCGGGGEENVCAEEFCEPSTCLAEGKNCGAISDGCGAMLNCGSCDPPETCGGGNVAHVCGCTAETQAAFCYRLGKNCGKVNGQDNCGAGRSVNCGTCDSPMSCGGAGTESVCGFSNDNWDFQVVDTNGDVGRRVSLALDAGDVPHLSYTAGDSDTDLRYAYYDNDHWEVMVVDDDVFAGEYASLALDSAGAAHIAQRSYGSLWYMSRGGDNVWEGTKISVHGGYHANLDFDSNDNPHLCDAPYNSITGGSLRYTAYSQGSGWQAETVQSSADSAARVGEYCAIRLDSSDRVHIAYEDGNFFRIMYAYNDGTGWDLDTIEDSSIGGYTSLALDSNDDPVVSYHLTMDGQVRVARKSGSTWTVEDVDTVGAIAVYTSLVLDDTDKVHLSYFDAGPPGLIKYARETDDGFDIEVIAIVGTGTGGYNDLVRDSSGKMHLAYYNALSQELIFASQR